MDTKNYFLSVLRAYPGSLNLNALSQRLLDSLSQIKNADFKLELRLAKDQSAPGSNFKPMLYINIQDSSNNSLDSVTLYHSSSKNLSRITILPDNDSSAYFETKAGAPAKVLNTALREIARVCHQRSGSEITLALTEGSPAVDSLKEAMRAIPNSKLSIIKKGFLQRDGHETTLDNLRELIPANKVDALNDDLMIEVTDQPLSGASYDSDNTDRSEFPSAMTDYLRNIYQAKKGK